MQFEGGGVINNYDYVHVDLCMYMHRSTYNMQYGDGKLIDCSIIKYVVF